MQSNAKMKIGFNDKFYNLIKSVDFSEIKNNIKFIDDEKAIEMPDESITIKDAFGDSFEEAPIDALLNCIDSEITNTGLSLDQNEVLPRGRDLYELYDSILYSWSMHKPKCEKHCVEWASENGASFNWKSA